MSKFDTADDITVLCYTMRLEREGVVYGWGDNWSGQLTGQVGDPHTLPSEITAFESVTDIATDEAASYFFNDTLVFAVGYGHSVPVKVELPPIRSIVSSSSSFAIDTSGRLLSWGDNYFGMLGRNYEGEKDNTPQLVDTLQGLKIKQVSSGCYHACCVTTDGEVFTWGHKSYVGQGVLDSDIEVPKKLEIEKISQISCGLVHTLLLSADQKNVWAFGVNHDTKLGLENWTERWETDSLERSPVKVPILGEKVIVKLECGGKDSAILYADGEIRVWGETWGQSSPRTFDIGKVVDISMGWRFMLALTVENRLYAFGRNDLGQCGQGHTDRFIEQPVEVKNLHNLHIKQISTGDAHCLIKCAKL